MSKPMRHRMMSADLTVATSLKEPVVTLCGLERVPYAESVNWPACPRCELVWPAYCADLATTWDQAYRQAVTDVVGAAEEVWPWQQDQNPHREQA